jgi:CheY-like chemotaxis protein
VAAEVEDGQAVVTVQDSGIGIPPGMLPRVFDMFAQVDRARDRAQGGLGIGLALVRKLVELHGGSVHAHSDGEGRGSRFLVRLPLLSATADAGGAAPAALAAPRTGGCTVLVVDDSPDSALSMSKIMELLGYRTVVAHDGLAAVQLTERHRPLVVLMDIGLPLLDGRDAARRIREGPGGHDMLLIAISGWGQEHDIEQSRRAGFDHHFVKPVDLARLTEVIGAFQAGLAGSRS